MCEAQARQAEGAERLSPQGWGEEAFLINSPPRFTAGRGEYGFNKATRPLRYGLSVSFPAGKVKQMLVPSPSLLVAQTRPPWRTMMRFTIARPML